MIWVYPSQFRFLACPLTLPFVCPFVEAVPLVLIAFLLPAFRGGSDTRTISGSLKKLGHTILKCS